jgi:hypothetical protein
MVGEAIMQGIRTQDWDWLRAGRGFHSDRPCANPVVTVHRRRRNVEQSRAWGQFGGVSAPSASRHCWGTSVAHSRLQPSPSSRRTPSAADRLPRPHGAAARVTPGTHLLLTADCSHPPAAEETHQQRFCPAPVR